MPTRNPNKTGELSKFYYMIANTDFGTDNTTDAALLNLGTWKEFCIKNLDRSSTRDMREIMDRCNPTLKTYSPGRSDKSMSFELNQFRWPLEDLQPFHVAVEAASIFTILALNDEREQTEAWGWIGNFQIEENSGTEPEDGLNTESFSLKPASLSVTNPAIRWIYGSDIPIT